MAEGSYVRLNEFQKVCHYSRERVTKEYCNRCNQRGFETEMLPEKEQNSGESLIRGCERGLRVLRSRGHLFQLKQLDAQATRVSYDRGFNEACKAANIAMHDARSIAPLVNPPVSADHLAIARYPSEFIGIEDAANSKTRYYVQDDDASS